MKVISIFALFAVLCSNSFASETAPLFVEQPHGEPNIFDSIMTKFSNGTLPEFTPSIGWWTGRCYAPETPNEAEGMLLVIGESTIVENPNDGPDFPPITKVVQNMIFLNKGTVPADFFDDLSDRLRSEIVDFINSDSFKSLIAYAANGSLNADYAGQVRYAIRKYGDNFYGPASLISSSGERVIRACYFFKKVN